MRPLIDPFGRRITYLRVSVTDRCDFRCVYCMAEAMTFLPREDLMTLEEIDRLASAFIAKGVRKLRLTGGEPLARRDLPPGERADLATEAADYALMAVLAKLDSFRGASRFTTWAYKFALLEAGVKARRRAWRDREIAGPR